MNPRIATRVLLGLAIAGVAAVLQGSALGAGATPSVRPGLWEYSYKALGLPVGGKKLCVKPDNMDKFFAGPCNHLHSCSYPTKVIGDGHITLKGQWVDKRGQAAPVSATGTYTDTTLELRAVVDPIGILPLINASTSAKWVAADCPAGTPEA